MKNTDCDLNMEHAAAVLNNHFNLMFDCVIAYDQRIEIFIVAKILHIVQF